MFISINSNNPQERLIRQVADCIKKGGLVIYPTDSVYGLGCDLFNQRAIEKLCRIKGLKPNKMQLTFLCSDLSQISEYSRNISTPLFKMMRQTLPGPYTYILESSTKVPKILGFPKKTVGIRVPQNNIILNIINELGTPILNTSVKDEDEILEYTTDPEVINDRYKNLVDIIIDGGVVGNRPTTVIQCVDNKVELIREGLGKIDFLDLE